MAKDTISILDGSTFLVGDLRGDIDASPDQPHGFFYRDRTVNPHLPDTIERSELAGIPGRWGQTDPTTALKEAIA